MYTIQFLLFALVKFTLLAITPVNSWTAEFLTQTQALQCKPNDQQKDFTFVHGRQAGNFTTLGQVEDMDVCVLLCCELDTCQAAFLEDKSCFSVRCLSKDHCATAPAVAVPKGQVSVAFVTRLQDTPQVQSLQDAKPKPVETKPPIVKPASNPAPKNRPSPVKKPTHQDDKTQKTGDIKLDEEKEEKMEPEPVKKNESLPELQAVQADKRKKETKKKEVKKMQYSLISAAVATCLVALILTGIALVAVKIRKQRERADSEEKMKLTEEGN